MQFYDAATGRDCKLVCRRCTYRRPVDLSRITVPDRGFPVVPCRFFESCSARSLGGRLSRLFEPVRSFERRKNEPGCTHATTGGPEICARPQKVTFVETNVGYSEPIMRQGVQLIRRYAIKHDLSP